MTDMMQFSAPMHDHVPPKGKPFIGMYDGEATIIYRGSWGYWKWNEEDDNFSGITQTPDFWFLPDQMTDVEMVRETKEEQAPLRDHPEKDGQALLTVFCEGKVSDNCGKIVLHVQEAEGSEGFDVRLGHWIKVFRADDNELVGFKMHGFNSKGVDGIFSTLDALRVNVMTVVARDIREAYDPPGDSFDDTYSYVKTKAWK